MLSSDEIANLRRLLLSPLASDWALVLQILEGFVGNNFPKELIPDLLVIFHQSGKSTRELFKNLLSKLNEPKLEERLDRLEKDEAFQYNQERLTARGLRRDIAKYTDSPSQMLNFARMLFFKYKKGLPFLLAELSEKAVIQLLETKIENGVKLNLSRLKLNFIPKEICAFPNIEELDLSQNTINNIPRFIAVFKNLKILRLNNCRLCHLHKNIGKLKQLEELDIAYNLLVKIPSEIGGLVNLKILKMIACSYSYYSASLEMPESIRQLKKVESIEVGYSSGQSMLFSNYPRFAKFVRTNPPLNLEPLQLARDLFSAKKEALSYLFKHAPKAEVRQLFELYYDSTTQKCDLSNILLGYLPALIGDYAIKTIDFTKCSLGTAALVAAGRKEEYDQEIDQVFEPLGQCKDLEILILRDNYLRKLPDVILTLKNLKHLDLAGNTLNNVPKTLQALQKLESIVLSSSFIYYDLNTDLLLTLPALKKIKLIQSYFKGVEGERVLARFKAKLAHCILIFE